MSHQTDCTNIAIDDTLQLERLNDSHANDLFKQTEANREYLRQWLPWVDSTQSLDDTRAFIQSTIEQHRNGDGAQFAVNYRDSICGVIGFHRLDKPNRAATIGYWLAESSTGNGIMHSSTKALLKLGFDEYQLHKIGIHCAEANARSRAIANRLGFTHEATLRDCEWLNGQFVNHAIYTLLATEYRERR